VADVNVSCRNVSGACVNLCGQEGRAPLFVDECCEFCMVRRRLTCDVSVLKELRVLLYWADVRSLYCACVFIVSK